MDVSNLTPTPAPAGTTGAAPPSAGPRVRTDRSTFESAVPSAPAPAAGVARPALGAADGSDRIERSPELQRDFAELKLELSRLAVPPPERIAQLRSELSDAAPASQAAFDVAASGLLRGEPFFAT